jgi:hypothetical protein
MKFALYRDKTRVSSVYDTEPELWGFVRANGFCEEAVGNEWQDATRVLRPGYLIFKCSAAGEPLEAEPEKRWI